ncbi:hypothetical protein SAMN02910265_02160 [Ruminococcus flavefaciens]|uniref:Dockerin domain-containing protein n=1 Tax=Ruminococcus flavefaciens TaxID=1265 RepID=A0A1H6K9P5_RUMFL|nr:dockerin type I repeat-containing protein [Ruminococcus flavefaciens]SEH69209.1 hypothetical protein SAMN02910265_02160 [Ruminococcus flavefaciens]
MKFKKALSILGALVLSFSYASSAAVCTSASLISDIVDKVNNDVFNYFSIIEETGGYSSAVIAMEEPASTLEFRNIEESQLKAQPPMYYAGTIEIGGETYHVCRRKGLTYTEKIENLETDYNDYIFYHVCPDGSSSEEFPSFPLYELIEGAKHFGLKTGKMSSVKLDENTYKCNCDTTALKKEGVETTGKLYSDLSMMRANYMIIDNYVFYSPEYYLLRGSNMYAYTGGCFTVNAKEYQFLYTEKSVDSTVDINLNRTSVYELNSENDICIDCQMDDSLEGKYAMVYTFYTPYDTNSLITFRIVEKVAGMDMEEFFSSYSKKQGIGNDYSYRSSELMTTYTENGNEYDLYKVIYHFIGEFRSYDEVCYFAVRKDTDDAASYKDTMSVYDHMSHIPELESGSEIFDIELAFHNCGATGDISVIKNDIRFEKREATEIIAGDFNNDKIIDAFDIVSARNAIISKLDDENAKTDGRMDLNKNGSFDIADLVLLQSFVLGKIKTLP